MFGNTQTPVITSAQSMDKHIRHKVSPCPLFFCSCFVVRIILNLLLYIHQDLLSRPSSVLTQTLWINCLYNPRYKPVWEIPFLFPIYRWQSLKKSHRWEVYKSGFKPCFIGFQNGCFSALLGIAFQKNTTIRFICVAASSWIKLVLHIYNSAQGLFSYPHFQMCPVLYSWPVYKMYK